MWWQKAELYCRSESAVRDTDIKTADRRRVCHASYKWQLAQRKGTGMAHITSGGARGPQNTDGISDNVVSVGKGKALIILRSTMSLVHNDAPNAPAKSVMSARLALRCFLNAGKSDRQGSGRSGGDRAEGGGEEKTPADAAASAAWRGIMLAYTLRMRSNLSRNRSLIRLCTKYRFVGVSI